tara:strand:- start:40 stop:807 length:768 start_codon:yes stop_codon:yes gene_type:complete
MSTFQRYLGQFAITNSNKDFTVGGFAGELTTGDYYMSGAGDTQLAEHMQAVIRALDGGGTYPTATVTQSLTTGQITISLDVTATIAWTDAALGTLLGFEGTQSGAALYTGDFQARYCWFPNLALSSYPGNLSDWWSRTSTTRGHRAPLGQTYTRKGNLLYDGRYEYQHLPPAQVWKEGSAWWKSFESFFEDVIHEGQPFRCFPDRSLNTATDYKTAIWAPEEAQPIGSMTEVANRNITNYNGFWRVNMPLWKHVT